MIFAVGRRNQLNASQLPITAKKRNKTKEHEIKTGTKKKSER